jgi:hypothetical protein
LHFGARAVALVFLWLVARGPLRFFVCVGGEWSWSTEEEVRLQYPFLNLLNFEHDVSSSNESFIIIIVDIDIIVAMKLLMTIAE